MKPLFKTDVLKCSLFDIASSSMTFYLPTNKCECFTWLYLTLDATLL